MEPDNLRDDWTCSSCGIMNVWSRTTCSTTNCTQPRPDDRNSESAVIAKQSVSLSSSATPYVSHGPVYIGIPGRLSYYNYGDCTYWPLDLSAHPLYKNESGQMYRMPSVMDLYKCQSSGMLPAMGHYGLDVTSSHASAQVMNPCGSDMSGGRPGGLEPVALAQNASQTTQADPRLGFGLGEESQKKNGDRSHEYWSCPKCHNVNYFFRDICNIKSCRTPKPGLQGAKSRKKAKPEGSWKCVTCNYINFPLRMKCRRCTVDKPSETHKVPICTISAVISVSAHGAVSCNSCKVRSGCEGTSVDQENRSRKDNRN